MGAAFVGLLGIGAALLVRDGPCRTTPTRAAATTEIDNAQLPATPSTSTLTPSSVSTNTPIMDLGDLDDGTTKPASRARPRPQKRQSVSAPPKNPYDIAGPVKVWK